MATMNPAVAEASADFGALDRIEVERWPTEMPLFVLGVIIGVVVWAALTVTIIGLLYALLVAAFFFVLHAGFVTHVRGNGVRLGPDQFPELHARVRQLAARMGMQREPEAYLMQAGGALNALATKFMRTNMVVLFSDLLEACGDNAAARDMIIAHELGHIRAGHLRWRWLLLPFAFIPFLGTALSRAREYTCDRFGAAGAGDRDGALLGLTILAAGGKHGPKVNRQALVGQRRDLNTGWMTLGQWVSTHPPLAKRLSALDPALAAGQPSSAAGAVRALAILVTLFVAIVGGSVFVVARAGPLIERLLPGGLGALSGATDDTDQGIEDEPFYTAPASAAEDLRVAFDVVSTFLAVELASGRALPADWDELEQRWHETRGDVEMPSTPTTASRWATT